MAVDRNLLFAPGSEGDGDHTARYALRRVGDIVPTQRSVGCPFPGEPVKLESSRSRMHAGWDRSRRAAPSGPRSGMLLGRPLAAGSMNDVTRILSAVEQGENGAPEQLLPLVYDELRKLAAARLASEAPGQTLDATALVHEAYMRLVGSASDRTFANRKHFFVAASEAMRRILVENARRKGAPSAAAVCGAWNWKVTPSRARSATNVCSPWTRPWSASPRSSRRRQSCSNCTRSVASASPRRRRCWAFHQRPRTAGGPMRGPGSARRSRKKKIREREAFGRLMAH